jgi:acyl-CoA thioesterase II
MTGFDLAGRLSAVSTNMTVPRELCLGPPGAKHMSGGSCLGLAISALEAATGRALIAASAQFLSPLKSGDTFRIETALAKAGRSVAQASAVLLRDDAVCVSVTAALGESAATETRQWARPPDAPPPDLCAPLPFIRNDAGDLHSHLDVRMVPGSAGPDTGGLVFWVRMDGAITSAVLAAIGDYLPECVHWSLGRPAGATSLDNSVRVLSREQTPWLLCESQLFAVAGGAFHGRMNIFAQSGALLAVASQSGLVREMRD